MTIASTPGFSPGTNPAQDVTPMKGGIFHASIVMGTSSRGKETLTTLSVVSGFPPVAAAMRDASIAGFSVAAAGLAGAAAVVAGGGAGAAAGPAATVTRGGSAALLGTAASGAPPPQADARAPA